MTFFLPFYVPFFYMNSLFFIYFAKASIKDLFPPPLFSVSFLSATHIVKAASFHSTASFFLGLWVAEKIPSSFYTFAGPQHPFPTSRGRSEIPRTLLRPPTRRPEGVEPELAGPDVPPSRYRIPPARRTTKAPRTPPTTTTVMSVRPTPQRGTGLPSRVTAVSVSSEGRDGSNVPPVWAAADGSPSPTDIFFI